MQEMVVTTIEHVTLFNKSIISISNADALVKLLQSIYNEYAEEVEDNNVMSSIQTSIYETSKAFLCMEWRNPKKSAKFNLHVESILGHNFIKLFVLNVALALGIFHPKKVGFNRMKSF